MSTAGPNQGGAAANRTSSGNAWTNPGNGVTENSTSATCSLANDNASDYLDITTFGTFSGVGAGDNIDTVQIEVRCSQSVASQIDWQTFDFIIGGTPQGNDYGTGSWSPGTSLGYLSVTVDPTNDLGAPMSGADFASGFGVALGFYNSNVSTSIISVDAVRVTLTGTFTGGGGGGGSNSSFLAFFRKVKEWLGWRPRRRSQTLVWNS